MIRRLILTAVLALSFAPTLAAADAWTDGQERWAAHGFRHGKWDCYGNCPDGRRPDRRARYRG